MFSSDTNFSSEEGPNLTDDKLEIKTKEKALLAQVRANQLEDSDDNNDEFEIDTSKRKRGRPKKGGGATRRVALSLSDEQCSLLTSLANAYGMVNLTTFSTTIIADAIIQAVNEGIIPADHSQLMKEYKLLIIFLKKVAGNSDVRRSEVNSVANIIDCDPNDLINAIFN